VLIDMALSTAAEKKIWGAITRSLATTVIFATHMVTSDRRRLSRPAGCDGPHWPEMRSRQL